MGKYKLVFLKEEGWVKNSPLKRGVQGCVKKRALEDIKAMSKKLKINTPLNPLFLEGKKDSQSKLEDLPLEIRKNH